MDSEVGSEGIVKLDRVTVCLPTKNRQVSHAFYAALGFVTVGELGDDGLPEPLQFEISVGLRVMLIPTRGFGWVIGNRKRSPRNTHECLLVIGLATDAAVDKLMRRAQDAGGKIAMEAGNQKWGYAGAFADPDGHMWQVNGAGGAPGVPSRRRPLRAATVTPRRRRSSPSSIGHDNPRGTSTV